jgi:hypothetical protein
MRSLWYHRTIGSVLVSLIVLAVHGGRALEGSEPARTPSTKPPDLSATDPHLDPIEAPKPAAIDAAIDRGVRFLLERQNKDGSWGSPRHTTGQDVYAPVPGAHMAFRTGVTALCTMALIEAAPRRTLHAPREDARHAERDEYTKSIDRGEAWLEENAPKLRRADQVALYNNWGHAYAIQALAAMYDRHAGDPARQERIRKEIQEQVGFLQRYECVDGGWCYYDFNAHTQRPSGSTISFVTATCMVALHEADRVGVKPPERIIRRAKASILRQREPDFAYDYGEYLKYIPMHPINRISGSLGRSQACNLAMRLWGDTQVTDHVLSVCLDRLFVRNLWLDLARKRPIPHESWSAVAAYFFYYGHYYAALCIEQLPPARRPLYQDHLARVLLPLQEKDGSWWDFPLYDYHQQYGTAFALMSLARCKHK